MSCVLEWLSAIYVIQMRIFAAIYAIQMRIFAITSIPPSANNIRMAFDCERNSQTNLAKFVACSSFFSFLLSLAFHFDSATNTHLSL